MIVKKQYIPKRYRSKKLVNASGAVTVGGSFTSGGQLDMSAYLLADKFDSLFEYDEVNDAIKAKLPFYSIGEVAAYGIGTGGSGGGTSFSRLDEWSLYTNDKSGWVLSALLGKDLHDRVLVLEAGGGGGGIATEIDPTVAAHIKNITSGDIANWATAYAKSHEHPNTSVLNATTASFLTADRTKLDGIAAGANNYTHPATHAPSIIAQDANNRFVTDTNIATWNAKEPAITKGTTAQYFRGDMSLALFPTALPASDVSDWAKEATKPSYVWSEIGSKPTTFAPSAHTHNKSDITNFAHTHYKSDILDFAHTHNLSEIGITGLTANYLTKFNGSTLVNSSIFDNGTNVGIGTAYPTVLLDVAGSMYIRGNQTFAGAGTHYIGGASEGINLSWTWWNGASDQQWMYLKDGGNVGIGTTNPTATLDVNGIGKFKDDILMTFNTWSHATNKNSLDKFLKLFDIDTAGNLVVKTNLYSTGEVTAYSSGTGVSGLTLMADMDANEKNINNVNSISKSGSKISLSDPTFIAFSIWDSDQFVIADDGIYAMTNIEASSFYTSGAVNATEFKFGNWTFKQDTSGRLGIYNGLSEVACFNTDGTYVNL